MADDLNASLRQHLLELLTGGHAHASFEDAIKGLPPKLRAGPNRKISRTARG